MNLDQVFSIAASSVLAKWRIYGEKEDLEQELQLWAYERPSTRKWMEEKEDAECIAAAKRAANQILSAKVLEGNMSSGRAVFSSNDVKEALAGNSASRQLRDLLITATATLQQRSYAQAEALRSRYEDGIVPEQGADHALLHRAVKSLTSWVNVLFLTAEGADSPHAVAAHSRKSAWRHSDPTADAAIALVEHGDDPIVLCALEVRHTEKFGEVPQPVRDARGRAVDSEHTTTYRKELFS